MKVNFNVETKKVQKENFIEINQGETNISFDISFVTVTKVVENCDCAMEFLLPNGNNVTTKRGKIVGNNIAILVPNQIFLEAGAVVFQIVIYANTEIIKSVVNSETQFIINKSVNALKEIVDNKQDIVSDIINKLSDIETRYQKIIADDFGGKVLREVLIYDMNDPLKNFNKANGIQTVNNNWGYSINNGIEYDFTPFSKLQISMAANYGGGFTYFLNLNDLCWHTQQAGESGFVYMGGGASENDTPANSAVSNSYFSVTFSKCCVDKTKTKFWHMLAVQMYNSTINKWDTDVVYPDKLMTILPRNGNNAFYISRIVGIY